MKFVGIIPARFQSTRFPGKSLADINGKSMIQRVYERVSRSHSLSHFTVATDDERIEEHVKSFGSNVIMTSVRHPTGTDRCYEAAEKIKSSLDLANQDVVINIQGDEPFIHPEQIDTLAECFKNEETQIATLVKELKSEAELFSPHTAKVVINKDSQALYFSRSPIPFYRNKEQKEWLSTHRYWKHIGIYAYRLQTLKQLVNLMQSPLEIVESLEQLRWLENGYKIKVAITDRESVCIDTPEDLERVKNSHHTFDE